LLKPNGLLTISGILANQIHQLEQVYHPHFSLVVTEIEHDWALLAFEKIDTEKLLLN